MRIGVKELKAELSVGEGWANIKITKEGSDSRNKANKGVHQTARLIRIKYFSHKDKSSRKQPQVCMKCCLGVQILK